ncbi:MAG: hypothetical protein N2376_00945 [Clostridia bacterium]|nr:hypothetical protein [Clostridia bacterium]
MRFKRKSQWAMVLFVLFTFAAVIAVSAAGSGQPGSDTDPLVTKSYVDQQIAKLQAQAGSSGTSSGTVDAQTITQLQTDVGDLTKFIIDAMTEIQTLKARVDALEKGFVTVQVKAGQKLLVSSGSEAVLRSGKATAIKGSKGSLVDVTGAAELANGAFVALNHLVISSESDGRGLLIKADGYVLVRGPYSVN